MESAKQHRNVEAPNWVYRLGESRAMFEMGAFAASAPWLRMLGRGDRHPVLVLPGFTASDASTAPIRGTLRSQGYWAHGWNLGTNVGPIDRIFDGIHDRLAQIYERHDRKVSIVGWSLGGIYARELARDNPETVRQIITLGSPFRMTTADRSTVSKLADALTPAWKEEVMHLAIDEADKPPLTVPSTAIYSRSDGIVRWHMCIDQVSEKHENIEVCGSHSGLGFNPAVLYAISDRLNQPEDDWRPFSSPLMARHLFPKPASWAEQVKYERRFNRPRVERNSA